MPDTHIQSADKNIVDKRRGGNSVRQSLRDIKHVRIEPEPSAQDFVGELLKRHAKVQWLYKLAFFLTIVLAGWLGSSIINQTVLVGWMAVSGLAAFGQMFAAKRFLGLLPSLKDEKKWLKIFCAAQVTSGLIWAAFFIVLPWNGEGGLINSITFASSMVIMALALLTASNLRFGVVMATLPFVLVAALRVSWDGNMAGLGMAAVLVGACLFFEHIGSHMRASWATHLHSEVVRDQLIVELEAATAISDEARRRAEEANLAKSRFLATMSHELRTPLNAILGFSEVMSNEVMGPLGNDHYREYITDIHSSGSHLLNLINEILDLSRVEAGRYEMNEEPVSLTHAAEETQQMMKLKANKKQINIIMQSQPCLPEMRADARAVRQIILNLLTKALKFTPEGGTIWVKVGWTAGGGQYVSIKDSGPGIPEDEIPVVLSSFGQGSIAIKSAEQGTGLGLPIVQALVHMHDGHFELKSKLREGTEVIATFPRGRVLATMIPGTAATMHKPTGNQEFSKARQKVSAPPMVGIGGVEAEPEAAAG